MVAIPYMGKFCFDNTKYVREETKALTERAEHFNRLYLEFGGKLLDDYHAARVLPGYDTNVKLDVLKALAKKKSVELLMVLNAEYIESNKPTGSLAMSYADFALTMLKFLKAKGFKLDTIVMSFFEGQKKAKAFASMLKEEGYNVYYTYRIEGYPKNVRAILSSRGFAKRPFLKGLDSDVVAITAPGPNSGKMATALMLIYQDYLRGRDSGYAKLETFPVWDLPLTSAVNMAYEAATADIGDYNAIDPFYLKAYGKRAVNYNRDIKAFPLLRRLIEKITHKDSFMRSYLSPTDMGVNRVSAAIKNLSLCNEAAKAEIVRRYFRYRAMFKRGELSEEAAMRVKKLLRRLKASLTSSPVVKAAMSTGGAALFFNGRMYKARPTASLSAAANVICRALHLKDNAELRSAINELKRAKSFIGGLKGLPSKCSLTSKDVLTLAFALAHAKPADFIGAELHSLEALSEEEERFFVDLAMNATWGKV